MKNQQKKYNSALLLFGIVATIFAIYFGLKSKNLSNELSRKNLVILGNENSPKTDSNSVSKIDELLFKGEYNNALKITNELKEVNFKNDSMLLLRHHLVSEIVAVKSLEKTTVKQYPNTTTPNKNIAFQDVGIKESNSQESTISNPKSLIAEINPGKTQNLSKDSGYLTFTTSKGTNLHYIGVIKNTKANGYGTAILESGSRYEGQWKNNQRHGNGKFFWNDGEYYEGNYSKDKRDGIGTYYWKNGEKYTGKWKDDKRNGKGEFFNKKGKLKTSGIWKNDELVEHDKVKKH